LSRTATTREDLRPDETRMIKNIGAILTHKEKEEKKENIYNVNRLMCFGNLLFTLFFIRIA